MNVTAVIGNYNGEAVLEDCLASLARQTIPPDEIIVADAGSTDRSKPVVDRHGAHWLPLENRGLGHLYNQGAERARTPYVLLSNNDVAYDEHCVELLVRTLDDHASLLAADPRQMDWSGERVVHARSTLRRAGLFRELLPGLHLDLQAPADGRIATVTANAGAMLVRRDILLELGGFDETFFLDVEDLDLCWRAWLRGHGSVYVPDAWLRHHVGAGTTAAIMPRRLRSSHHNLMRFALKCLPAREAAVVLVGELARLPRHPQPIAGAFLSLARELPQILRLRREARPRRALLEWMLGGQGGECPARRD